MSFCKGSMINLIAPVDRTAIRELIRKTSDLKFQKTHRHIYRILTKAGNQRTEADLSYSMTKRSLFARCARMRII